MILPRRRHLQTLTDCLRRYPVVAMLGASQVGKTTLARQLVDGLPGRATVFDLENPRDLARLDDPLLALESLRGLVVLDEIQRRPDLWIPAARKLACGFMSGEAGACGKSSRDGDASPQDWQAPFRAPDLTCRIGSPEPAARSASRPVC